MAEKDSSPERKKESSGSPYDVEKMDAFLQKQIFTDDSKQDGSYKQNLRLQKDTSKKLVVNDDTASNNVGSSANQCGQYRLMLGTGSSQEDPVTKPLQMKCNEQDQNKCTNRESRPRHRSHNNHRRIGKRNQRGYMYREHLKLFGSDSSQEHMKNRSATTDVQTVTENVTSCSSRTQDNSRRIICDSESRRSNSTPDDHRETSSESCENIIIERKKVKRLRKRRYHHSNNSKSTSSNSESDVEVINGSQFNFDVSSQDSSSENMEVTSILKKACLVEDCYTQYRKAQKKDFKQYSNEQKDEDDDSIEVEPKRSDDSHYDSFLGYDTEDDDDNDIKAFTV